MNAEARIRELVKGGARARMFVRPVDGQPWMKHVHIMIDGFQIAAAVESYPEMMDGVLNQLIDLCLRRQVTGSGHVDCDCRQE